MKTILLYVGAALLVLSCDDVSNNEIPQNLPIDEMKARVPAEEILFEKETNAADTNIEDEESIPEHQPIDPQPGYGDPLPDAYDVHELAPEAPRPSPPGINLPIPVVNSNDSIVDFPDVDADYPGGIAELKKFIHENLKYPERVVSYYGRVYVTFVVGKDGFIRNEKVFRGISKELDAEALRVIRAMPNWIPAKHNGKVVATKVRLPINFDLN